jgi:hypothetical protein
MKKNVTRFTAGSAQDFYAGNPAFRAYLRLAS